MQDPVGLIGSTSGMQGIRQQAGLARNVGPAEGAPDFMELLKSQLNEVNELTIHEIYAAIDCGVPVNPDRIMAQMEGASSMA